MEKKAWLEKNRIQLQNLINSIQESDNRQTATVANLIRISEGLVDHFSQFSKKASEFGLDHKETSAITPSAMTGMIRFLVSKGVSKKIAEDIESRLNQQFGYTDMSIPGEERSRRIQALKKELSQYIKTGGPISLISGQPTFVAIVGPTGVGKTTTLIKLANQYKYQLKKHVLVIALGENRSGDEHIVALSEKYQLPFIYAPSANELHEGLGSHPKADLILIDTAGRNQYQWEELDDLTEMLSTLSPLHIHLAISATTKDVDVYGIIRHYSRLNIESLIFTKLDETIAHGVLVNACYYAKKPISYLTTGSDILDDLKIADPHEIARSILTRHNSPEFEEIRQIALQSYE
jgi:flagellar biosynthesis protein FlhF